MTRSDGRNRPAVFASERPQVFGHRGAAGLAPENTMAGFTAGLAAGADGVECDVRLSADGVPVVIHDPTLDRTTDVTGDVAARTVAELARVDATCRFEPPAGVARATRQGVPVFADVLAAWREARVIVELKDEDPRLADAVVAVVRRADAASRICLGSFHHPVLARARRLAPELTTGASLPEARRLLIRAQVRWPFTRSAPFRALQVPPVRGRVRVVTPRFVRQAHQERACVQVWTVNTPEDVTRLLAMGVDGVISDRPDIAIAARDAFAVGQ